ncbi:uncharacterized protein LOC126778039 [Nymphalis io]|uniref:uncharacterized protein LOC126778039 n=1 Tax=Inachis io TaxID=171585 RepID=UPI00216979A1|nr:uncharacterized protein LOC126778039 [Nymphalis io]
MKCTKVKNPCKICFQSVSKKNGLQCQGACQKWAHYKCLNYTPGKIQDIKAGLIEITCPCPDCNTSTPKEKLVNPPFTCTNTKCPANKLPVCTSKDCPSNQNPIPMYPPPPFEYSPKASPIPPPPPHVEYSPKETPICPPTPLKCPVKKTQSPPPIHTKRIQPTRGAHTSKLNPHLNYSPPTTPPICKPKTLAKPCPPPFCPSQQSVSKQKRKVAHQGCTPKQSQSYSNLSNNSIFSDKQQLENLRGVSSDSQVNDDVDQKMLCMAIENLCTTVGELSHQLKYLMYKMNQT